MQLEKLSTTAKKLSVKTLEIGFKTFLARKWLLMRAYVTSRQDVKRGIDKSVKKSPQVCR